MNFIHAYDIGARFGRLTLIGMEKRRHASTGYMRSWALARCDCGSEIEVVPKDLHSGNTTSCGCSRVESWRSRPSYHGGSQTRLHNIWTSMKGRCYNRNNAKFPIYGGRGISVCPEWKASFQTFQSWALNAGYADDLTVDRIDVNGNYEPDNCRFITPAQQALNRRNTLYVTAFGERKSLSEWARDTRCVVVYHTLYGRIVAGWEPETALTEASSKYHSGAYRSRRFKRL